MDISQNYIEAVKAIKEAILRSQYRAAASVNKEQLSLYYGIGRYVSENSRRGFWGKGAIEHISSTLQKELPGLRGFSARSIKNMRQFYEEWEVVLNQQPMAADLKLDEKLLLVEIPAAPAAATAATAVESRSRAVVAKLTGESFAASTTWPRSRNFCCAVMFRGRSDSSRRSVRFFICQVLEPTRYGAPAKCRARYFAGCCPQIYRFFSEKAIPPPAVCG